MPKSVNFTDAIDPFAPVPAGTYRVKVEKATIKEAGSESKHPGSDYLALELSIQDEEYAGKRVWMNCSMHPDPKLIGGLKRNLEILGEEVPDGDFEVNEDNLVSRECNAVVTVGTNPRDGQPNNSVKRLVALDEESSILP